MRSKIIIALFLIIPVLFIATATVSFFLVKNSLVQSEESKQVKVAEIVKQNLNIYFESLKNSLENQALSKTFSDAAKNKSDGPDLRNIVVSEKLVKAEFERLQLKGFLSDPRTHIPKGDYKSGNLTAWQLYKGLPDINPINKHPVALAKRESLKNLLYSHRDFHYAFEMENNGDLVFLEPFDVQKNITSFNYAFRDYLQMVKKTMRTSVSEGYISHDAARTQIITVATPLFGEFGGIRSILAASISAKTLANRIFIPLKETIGLTDNSYIMLIDRHGHIVASSQSKHIYFPLSSVGSDDNDDGNIRNLGFFKDFKWHDDVLEGGNIWERKTKSWESDVLPKSITGIYTNLDSKKVIGTFLPISFGVNESSVNWAILVETPVSFLSAVVRNVATLFIVVGLLLLCIVIVLIAVVRKNIYLLENDVRMEAFKGERKLKEAMYRIAHDIRKPLMGMKTILHLMPSMANNHSKMEKFTADVDRNITQTNAMLNDMLDFSNESLKIVHKEANPQSIITSALSDALRNHPDCTISIEYELKHNAFLFVDSDKTIRILTNIIDNAIDAMSEDGKIWFKTSPEQKGFIALTVGNDGTLITEDVKQRLFEPYFTKDKKGGTGLGLSICKNIVELHNGSIEVFSERKNEKNETEFIVRLPASCGKPEVKEEELIYHSNEMKSFRNEEARRTQYGDTANFETFMRINKERGCLSYLLVVDDDPLFRETIRGLLNNLGQVKDHIKVIEADSAEAGLKLLDQHKFDYIIIDIDLGRAKMNGYKFAATVLEKSPNTYVLIHSNKRKEEMDEKIRGLSTSTSRFLGFLPKPMKASELLQFLACKSFENSSPPLSRGGQVGKLAGSQVNKNLQTCEHANLKTILLLNDDEEFLAGVKLDLKSMGYNVLDALSVAEAMKHLAEYSNIHAIVSDINLGLHVPSGFDFLRQVREKDKEIPFIITSGYSKDEIWGRAESLGATDFLQLPFDTEDLGRLIG